MNDHQITAKRMAGQRLSSEERDHLSDQEQEDRRMEIENKITPRHGDRRITMILLDTDADMGRTISKARIVVEFYHYSTKAWRRHESTEWLSVQGYAQSVLSWVDDQKIAKMQGFEQWLAPRLIKHEEIDPGVWEFWVERRTSD